ncbi:CLUMA_CG018439, isoform A [Clunio marinus]|uniref:CLUMA_CG018439, isoform A n=1 Tax=Clunio marinus TaxID=568069 RepID=A0A1J1J0I4_9DIPT|nr:CLUMA_CG018439, isoform A [Clunio marinus]
MNKHVIHLRLMKANKTSWKIFLLSNKDASSAVTFSRELATFCFDCYDMIHDIKFFNIYLFGNHVVK